MDKNAKNVLEVDDMSVEFHTPSGVVHAVSHVTFHLKQGEILGIVGESGSGKSVTANAIMRLLPDTAKITGSIKLNGRDIMSIPNREFNKIRGKDIAMIFQDPMTSLNPLYTVGNQLVETLKLHMGLKGEAARKRAIELLDMVSIPQPEVRFKQYPHEFSGGMRQRVMIAIAMCCRPGLLIADEPTTALDVTIQAQILELMAHMKNEFQTSVILITHDLGVISSMCTRVIVMYGGLIMEEGAIEDIFYRTGHPYTAGLLASIPQKSREKLVPIYGTPPDLLNPPAGCPFAARCPHAMKLCAKCQPQFFDLGGGHRSACWLHHPSVKAQKGEVKLG